MSLKALTIYQKINYFLLLYIGISFLIILIGGITDLVQIYILHTWNEESGSSAIFLFWLLIGVHFLIIMPNTFTIYVHEMRKQINPPIPKWYNMIKNGFIISMITLVLLPIFIYPFIISKQPGDVAFLTKFFIEKRHSTIKSGNSDVLFATILAIFFCIPFIGFLNWVHAISWKGYLLCRNMIK